MPAGPMRSSPPAQRMFMMPNEVETVEHMGHLIVNTARGEWTVYEDKSKETPLWVADTIGKCVDVIDEVMSDM